MRHAGCSRRKEGREGFSPFRENPSRPRFPGGSHVVARPIQDGAVLERSVVSLYARDREAPGNDRRTGCPRIASRWSTSRAIGPSSIPSATRAMRSSPNRARSRSTKQQPVVRACRSTSAGRRVRELIGNGKNGTWQMAFSICHLPCAICHLYFGAAAPRPRMPRSVEGGTIPFVRM